MTIIADSIYLKGDRSKLAHNSYSKRDSDFAGIILYFTPKGKYVGGYLYKNGKLQTSSTLSQSTNSVGNIKVNLLVNCVDWYADKYADGVLVSSVYLYTTCDSVNEIGGGGDSSGGSGLGGGGGSAPPPPPPCVPPSGGGNVENIGTGKVAVTGVEPPSDPGDGGGFPPPAECPTTVVFYITNNVKNECLNKMVDKIINKDITTVVNGLIQKVFGGSAKVNLAYSDALQLDPGVEGKAPFVSYNANGDLNLNVYLNANSLPNYTQEFIASVIMHESLHTYLTSIGQTSKYQHEDIMTYFVTQMAVDLKQMFPSLPENDAKNLALGGLQGTQAFKDQVSADIKATGSYDATKLAYTTGALGTKCN